MGLKTAIEDGYANFYDNAFSIGDCAGLLAKNWDHYVSPGQGRTAFTEPATPMSLQVARALRP